MLGSLIASRTALQYVMIVACSRILIVISSSDLVFRCSRVLYWTKGSHVTHCHNLSSEKHDLHPVRHESPGNVVC